MLERLNEIKRLIDNGATNLADAKLNEIYEDFISDRITLTDNEEEYMWLLFDKLLYKISNKIAKQKAKKEIRKRFPFLLLQYSTLKLKIKN